MKNVHAICVAALLSAGVVGIASAQAPAPPAEAPAAREPAAAPAAPAAAPAAREAAAPAAQERAAAPAAAQASAELAAGQKIYDQQGQEIGTIDSVEGGQAVISVGQFLGLGEKKVQLPATEFRARAEGGFTTAISADRLRQMPAHNAN